MSTTREQTAPFLGRLLLATDTGDHHAFVAALEDATSAGISVIDLLVVTSQVLVANLGVANPEWQTQVQLGLLEVHQHD